MDEIRGKIINVFDAWERGGFKGDSGIIDTFISQKKGKSKLTPELFSQFEIFKEEFNNSSLSAEALGEKMKNVDSRIIAYAKTCKNGELTTKGFQQSLDDLFYSAKTNAGKAVNQVFQATGNIILDTLISKGLTLAYTAIDNLVHKTEKAKERIQEANNTYQTSKSELQSLQAEFTATTQRIDELNSKKKLTFTDKSELEALNSQNAELEHSVELSEINNKLTLQDTLNTISDDYDDARKNYKKLENNENTKQRIKDDMAAAQTAIKEADQYYKGDQLADYIAEKQEQIIQYKTQLADYEHIVSQKYFDDAVQLENWIQAFEDKGISNLTQREAETYNQMVSDLDFIYKSILTDEEYMDLKIRPIFESEKFDGLYEQMISYFKNGGNIEGLSEVFGADIIKALKAACRDNGIEFTQLLNIMHNTASAEPLGLSFAPITKNPNNATDARINQESKDKINYYNSLSEDTKTAIDSGMISLSVDDSLEECKAKVAEWENTLENNHTSIQLTTNISNIKNDLDSLMNAYTDFADGKNIDISNLAMLNDSFGGLSEFSDFIETVTDVTATTEEVQDAFDNLSTAYIDNSDMLNSLNRDNADYIASQLELMGVTNAQEFVESRLSDIYGVESQAQKELINISNTLGNAKYNASNASKTLENASLSDIIAMANEASAAGVANSALVSLAMSKASSNGIITSNECSALAALAMQTGYTTSAFYELAAAKQAAENGTFKSSGNVYADEKRMQGINANARIAANLFSLKVKNGKLPTNYFGGGANRNNTAASQPKTTINWIERKLERLQKVIDATKAKFDNLFTVNKKTSNLDTQIKQTKSLLKANEKAAKRYQKYAKNNKLSDSLKKTVREGNYNIKDYDSKTADQINKYKEYYDKYQEAQKQADELAAQIRELKEKKYQVYIDDAAANIDKLNALSDISTTYEEKNKYLEDQKSYLKKSYDYQIKIAALTKNEAKKAQLQAEYEKELIELKNQKFENIQTYYESEIKLLDHQFTSLDNKISKAETAGKKVSQAYYEEQKKINEEKKKQYEEEKAKLEEQITDIPQGTKEWYDAKDAIQECANSISDCAKETYELNNAINQLYFDIFDDISESIDRIITEQEFLQDLFAHEKLTDDKTGYFTDAGLAKLGSLSASYYASKEKANNAEELLKELQNVKANGRQPDGTYKLPDNTDKLPDDTDKLGDWTFNSLDDLQEKINETYTEWQNSIKDTYSLESAIADLMKEQYQSELDMLQELIDAKKEALQTKKDLHDYKQSIQEKTNNISTIQKQIAAYQGDTSQEGLAKLQKLQVQLSEKEKELEETEYDRYISDQENMLDKLYTEYEELVTKKLEDFMTLVREGLDTANQKTAVISEYLSKVAGDNGYKIETDGLFDTVNGSISDSTSKIVAAIENQIKGDFSSENNSGKTESDAPFTHTGYHPLPSVELKKTKTSNLDIEKAFSKPVTALKSSKSMTKDDVDNFIKKYGTPPDPKKKNYGKVNIALIDGYSKVLSTAKMKELAKALDVTYDSDKIYSKLKSLNVPGFKEGGIVSVDNIKKQVHDNGDKVLMSANPGEGILTPDQTAQFETLVNKLPQLNFTVDAMNNLDKIPNPTNLVPVGNTTMGDMVFNIDMPNVTNPDEFIKTIQTNQKIQKALRLVTTDRIAGNGKLSVNKII